MGGLIIVDMLHLSDEELVAGHRSKAGGAGGNDYIDELFRRHYRRVGLWCFRILGDRERAADAAQEVFTSAYRNLDTFRGGSKFTTWLYTVTRNQCLNEIRSRERRPEGDLESLENVLPDGAADPLAQYESRDETGRLRRLMAEALDETERAVVWLHYMDELPLEAVTRALSLKNPSGAKAYIVNARRKLQEAAQRMLSGEKRQAGYERDQR